MKAATIATMERPVCQFIQINQFCARTMLSRATANRLIKSGKIRTIKLGRSVRIPESVLEDLQASAK